MHIQLPYRQLSKVPSIGWTIWKSLGLLSFTLALAWIFTRQGDGLTFSIVSFAFAILAFALVANVWMDDGYLRSGRTHSEISISEQTLAVRENRPMHSQWYRFDALPICRLRIIPIPDKGHSDSEGVEPSLWLLMKSEATFALVAEDEKGRRYRRLAVGYGRNELIEIARQVKRALDKMREDYHRELKEEFSHVSIPDPGKGIPICLGNRFDIANACPTLPKSSTIKYRQSSEKLEILAPRGEQLEEVRIAASVRGLQIRRKLLLGEVHIKIRAHELLQLRAEPITDSADWARLVLTFHDSTDQGNPHTLHLLEDRSVEEVCWVAAAMKKSLGASAVDSRASTFKPRFNIAQMLFITMLVALMCGPLSMDRAWGWLYGLQLVAIALGLVSFTGIKQLGWFTKRSWTKPQLVAVGVLFAIAWIFRFLTFLVSLTV